MVPGRRIGYSRRMQQTTRRNCVLDNELQYRIKEVTLGLKRSNKSVDFDPHIYKKARKSTPHRIKIKLSLDKTLTQTLN